MGTRTLVLALVVAAACGGGEGDPLTVEVDTGPVRGRMDGAVRAFLGIPYAAPPVGDLRFRPPQPALPWTGTYEALSVGNQCPQAFGLSVGGGDESCLYLNVWTPPAGGEPRPVLVWLHGGAFLFGSGGDPYYRGAKLAEQGVVVVTVNYRLGALGFLAHPALAAEDPSTPPGNQGLRDQIAALEWLQRNIAGFGGDPARVTIVGESAGGFSGCVHYVSPRSRGLFHAVISESGLCGGPGLAERTRPEAEAAGASFAADLGCTGAGALACLRGKAAFDFVDAAATAPIGQQEPGGLFFQPGDAVGLGPYVDGDVLPGTIASRLAAGGTTAPLLLGTNRDEGTFFVWEVIAKGVADDAEYRAALARRFGAGAVDAIVARYPSASYPTATAALAAVSGDAFFVCPARRTARAATAAGAPVYLYSFERVPEGSLLGDAGGVFHAAEIPFVFGYDEFPLGKVGAAGEPLRAAIQRYWTRFAAAGDPNGSPDVAWPRYGASDAHLVLDVPVAAGQGHRAEVCDFWDTAAP